MERGQLITSRKMLSKATGISEQTIRTTLQKLELSKKLTSKSTNRYTLITICNYNTYNKSRAKTNQVINQVKEEDIVMQNIMDTWNHFALKYGLVTIRSMTQTRVSLIRRRLKEKQFDIVAILKEAEQSNFLKGKGKGSWKLDFDWIIKKQNNYVRILEGTYRDNRYSKAEEQRFKEIQNSYFKN